MTLQGDWANCSLESQFVLEGASNKLRASIYVPGQNIHSLRGQEMNECDTASLPLTVQIKRRGSPLDDQPSAHWRGGNGAKGATEQTDDDIDCAHAERPTNEVTLLDVAMSNT